MPLTDGVSFQVTGLATVDAALRQVPEAVRGPVLAAALLDAGEVMRQDARGRIHSRTGRTVADLQTEVAIAPRGDGGMVNVGGTGRRSFVLRYLEFGTRPHRIPKRPRARGAAPTGQKRLAFGGIVRTSVRNPGMAARAPLRTALAETGEQAVDVLGRSLWDGIVAVLERQRPE